MKETTVEELLQQKSRDKKIKTILIVIIILLILIYWVSYRVGKIGYEETSSSPVETVTLIRATQDNMEIAQNTELNIFENPMFGGEKKIAPGSQGEYQFCIKNEIDENVVYHIRFFEETKYSVNMKFKLKKDNTYIRGSEDTYVDIDELDIEEIIALEDTINIYTLEWYWMDNDKIDTFIGSQKIEQYYELNLEIEANKYEEY